MNYSIIDIGSNTVRMTVYHVDQNCKFQPMFSEKEMAGLYNYVIDGAMSNDGIEKICSILKGFKTIIERLNMNIPYIFATASLRNISNTEFTLKKIKEITGLDLIVLSGEEEGRLGYLGIQNEVDFNKGVMVDIGGGSTEFVKISNNCITESTSFQIGSLALFKKNVTKILPKKKEIKKIHEQCDLLFKNAELNNLHCKNICFIGGTARAMLKICNRLYNYESSNRELKKNDLNVALEFIVSKSTDSRNLILKECPDRLHTIIPGAILLCYIVKQLNPNYIYVGKYGVREGYLCQKISN